jgi:nitrate/nitrite transporter NarK
MWTFSRLGGAVAPFLVVGLIGYLGRWEYVLILVAIIGLAWSVVFFIWFRNQPQAMPQVNAAELEIIESGRGRRAGHGHATWRRLLRSKNVWALCFMYGCAGFSANFYVTLFPSYLRDYRHFTEDQMKWASGLPLALGLGSCLAGGMISDWLIRSTGNRKWGRRLTGLVGHALAGATIYSTRWAVDVWTVSALFAAAFFFNDLAMGPAWAACADIGERDAGTLGGAMNMTGNLAGALAAFITGSLFGMEFDLVLESGRSYTLIGTDLVFVLYACSWYLGAFCWLNVDASKPLTATDSSTS